MGISSLFRGASENLRYNVLALLQVLINIVIKRANREEELVIKVQMQIWKKRRVS